MSLEDQNKSLHDQKSRHAHRIQELEKGLQELGREYQTLQIVTSRQSERKWEKDKEATSCNGCNAKFNVSTRRVSIGALDPVLFPLAFRCLKFTPI